MKKFFHILFLLFVISPLFAQNQSNKDFWAVYTINKQSKSKDKVQQVQFLSLVGDDNRIEITGEVHDWRKAVVVLIMTDNQDRKSICSGSMVGPKTVLTAAHCLIDEQNGGKFMKEIQVFATGMPTKEMYIDEDEPYKYPDEQAVAKLDEIKHKIFKNTQNIDELQNEIDTILPVNKNGIVPNIKVWEVDTPSANAIKLWVPREALQYYNDLAYEGIPFDYGLITLDEPIGNETGWLSLAVKSDDKLQNMEICVIGRGYDKPALSLWEGCGKIREVYKDFFQHDADTLGGNSGSPIFDKKDPGKIIALSNFGQRIGDQDHFPDGYYPNGGMRITPRIINAINAQINHGS